MILPELTKDKKRLLETDGHILALGGPGCGKTFIALLKAHHVIQSGYLLSGQSILFLSFARATIARVAQQSGKLLTEQENKVLEINTYHGFAWQIIQSHGYLHNSNKRIRLLPPPEASVRLADIEKENRIKEKQSLLDNEGLLHFDLFAEVCGKILTGSKALLRIISDTYPIIILDEFQDTNFDEWQMIQALGQKSILIALADPEQRIYEFRGAAPRRIGEFVAKYKPIEFDFSAENFRSNGTDICLFGNDLLTGNNKNKSYHNVFIKPYPFRKGNGLHCTLKYEVIEGCKRLRKAGLDNWSIAVLVPTKKLMIDVSDYLGKEQTFSSGKKLPLIHHEVALETFGPALAAILIAGLLEESSTNIETSHKLIMDLCEHIRGRKGSDSPNIENLKLTNALKEYIKSGKIRGLNRQQIIQECNRIAKEKHTTQLSGSPVEDWLKIRNLLFHSSAKVIQEVANDARYLRILYKGALLQSRLSELWKSHGYYKGAVSAVNGALLQEHFSASIKKYKGIQVMTIHKSKGKEFDEVIIYEDCFQGPIIKSNASENDIKQARLALRVAVTRAKRRTTILTPEQKKCNFL